MPSKALRLVEVLCNNKFPVVFQIFSNLWQIVSKFSVKENIKKWFTLNVLPHFQ